MTRRRWVVVTILTLAALLVVGRVIAGWYVDYQWYAALDAEAVWKAKAMNTLLLRGALFVAGTLFMFLNLYAVRHSIRKLVLPRRVGNLDIGEEVPGRYLLIAVILLSMLIGAVLALPRDWISLDLIRHGESFGETDPYFQHDLGFWLYWLPLESAIHLWALFSLLAATLVVVFLYALTPSLRWDNGHLHVSGYVRRHFFTLGAVLLLLLAWSYRLDAYGLLNDGSGALRAFSAIDHRIGLPANLILSIVAVAGAMLVIWSGWTGQIRTAFFAITAVLLIALTLRQIVPPVAVRFIAPSDSEQREKPYRDTRYGYTRRAYDVDRLTAEDGPVAPPSFADAIRGASLWDGAALNRVLSRALPSAKPNGALGWDAQDGRIVAFAAEQPTGPDAADSQPTWRSIRVAADLADDRGGTMERIDPEDMTSGILSSVLVHDSATNYYVIADSAGHVAAAELQSLRSRVAHAWHLQNPRLLSVTPATARARIVLRRDVRERLRALYPFFEQGGQVSPIVWRDSLFWAVHLYAVSEWYPLSLTMRFGTRDVHYLRHAAVALINAHTGRTAAIGDVSPDPVTSSWMHRFPSLFAEPGRFDPDLTRRIPIAVDGTIVLAVAFAQVGVRGEYLPPSHLPRQSGGDTVFALATTPPFFNAPIDRLSFAVPVLDASDHLRGVVVSDGGPDYRPRWHAVTTAERWTVTIERLQHPGDSLRSVIRETRPLQGPARVIPTADGVLILQTHYTTRPDGSPQEFYVSVLHGDTLKTGLTAVSAAGMPAPPAAQLPLTPEEFRLRVDALYGSMREAMRRSDWSAFGKAYEALGKLLRVPR